MSMFQRGAEPRHGGDARAEAVPGGAGAAPV